MLLWVSHEVCTADASTLFPCGLRIWCASRFFGMRGRIDEKMVQLRPPHDEHNGGNGRGTPNRHGGVRQLLRRTWPMPPPSPPPSPLGVAHNVLSCAIGPLRPCQCCPGRSNHIFLILLIPLAQSRPGSVSSHHRWSDFRLPGGGEHQTWSRGRQR